MSKKSQKSKPEKTDERKPMERIEDLEKSMLMAEQVIGGIQEILQTFSKAVDALTTLAGPEKVFAEIDKAHCVRQDTAIEQAIKEGQIEAVTQISDSSFVRGVQTLAGKTVRPGTYYNHVVDMKPEMRAGLVGQTLPATFQDPESGAVLLVSDAFDPKKGTTEAA